MTYNRVAYEVCARCSHVRALHPPSGRCRLVDRAAGRCACPEFVQRPTPLESSEGPSS